MLSYVENRENICESRFKKEREYTDFSFLVLCILLIATYLILFGYCIIFGNHDRNDKVFDDCMNFCGKLNEDNQFECGPKDLRKFPYLHIEYELLDLDNLTIKTIRKCVDSCPKNFTLIHNKCKETNKTEDDDEFVNSKLFDTTLTTNFSHNIRIFLQNVSTFRDSIATASLFALFFSFIFVILFRFVACYIIWIISIGTIGFVFGLAVFIMFMWNSEGGMMVMSIGIILSGVLFLFRRKAGLVAKIFKESSRIMVDIPAIIFGPVLTFIIFIISFKIFTIIASIIQNSGELHRKLDENGNISIYFQELPACVTAHMFNIITFAWFTQFILSCQYFMLAGTICKWYFIRDKEKLDLEKPIKTTFSHLKEQHLGSIFLGSMVISSVKIIRMMFRPFRKSTTDSKEQHEATSSCICFHPLSIIARILHYPSRVAYIVVAKEGRSFIESGKRAYQLKIRNIMDVMIIIDFGALILIISRILVVLAAGMFGYEILVLSSQESHLEIPLIIGGSFAFFIAHSFISFYEMMIDTILICFCIDCEENDGITSFYYMPESLRKIMMEMKNETGGKLTFGDKMDSGIADGSDTPMLSKFTRS